MPDEMTGQGASAAPAAPPPPASAAPPKNWMARVRGALHGPLLIGVIAALVAIALSFYGMLTNSSATPLTLRSAVLVILIAGGSWGLIAWAIATAAVEAGKD